MAHGAPVDEHEAVQGRAEEGVFATSVVFPTVALDQARLRTIVTAALTDEHLDRALDAFGRVGRELGIIAG